MLERVLWAVGLESGYVASIVHMCLDSWWLLIKWMCI